MNLRIGNRGCEPEDPLPAVAGKCTDPPALVDDMTAVCHWRARAGPSAAPALRCPNEHVDLRGGIRCGISIGERLPIRVESTQYTLYSVGVAFNCFHDAARGEDRES